MIKELTPKQIELLSVYRDKWIAYGLSCEPTDWDRAIRGVGMAYESAGLKKPKHIISLSSPLAGCIGTFLLSSPEVGAQVGAHVRAHVYDQVRDQVYAQVRAQVYDQVGDQVGAHVYDQVRDQVYAHVRAQVYDQVRAHVRAQVRAHVRAQVRDQVHDQVGAQVRAQVYDQVGAQVGAHIHDQVRDQVYAQVGAHIHDSIWGQHIAHWCGWADYMQNILFVRKIEQCSSLIEIAKSAGCWWAFRNAAIICERHAEFHLVEGKLHRDGGPAVAWSDGWGVYALNGVRVPGWLAEEKAEEIDPARFAKIDNVEIRREFVRKVGVERIVQEMGGQRLDAVGDYELIEVDLGGSTGRHPYLKMLNPSIGVWHLECVERTCRTVQQALNFRASRLTDRDWKPEVLT